MKKWLFSFWKQLLNTAQYKEKPKLQKHNTTAFMQWMMNDSNKSSILAEIIYTETDHKKTSMGLKTWKM